MSKYRKMDMRRWPRVMVIAPGIGARLHGDELVVPVLVAHRASGAGEIRIERSRVLIDHVYVAAASVRLPDLNQAVRHRPVILIKHAAVNDDALTDRLFLMLFG